MAWHGSSACMHTRVCVRVCVCIGLREGSLWQWSRLSSGCHHPNVSATPHTPRPARCAPRAHTSCMAWQPCRLRACLPMRAWSGGCYAARTQQQRRCWSAWPKASVGPACLLLCTALLRAADLLLGGDIVLQNLPSIVAAQVRSCHAHDHDLSLPPLPFKVLPPAGGAYHHTQALLAASAPHHLPTFPAPSAFTARHSTNL